MYKVFEDGKPAQYPDFDVHPSWDCCEFETFEDAVAYARHWLGPSAEGAIFNLNEPWDYGYGSTIEIREIK